MSQPAVSKALRRLRDTFDDPLFVRGPSGIEIRSGLDEQARVISPFPQDLKDGARVTITGAAK